MCNSQSSRAMTPCAALHSRKCAPALRCGTVPGKHCWQPPHVLHGAHSPHSGCNICTYCTFKDLLHVQATADVTDPHAIEMLCAEGRDAADFLMQNVVQAQLNDRGNYGGCTHLYHLQLQWGADSSYVLELVCMSARGCLGGAAMTVEQQHVGSVAEEAALRPDRPPP